MDAIYHRVRESTTSPEVLGITDAPTYENVRAAYRALALQLHPDKSPPELAELHAQYFIRVTEAYEYLLRKLDHDAREAARVEAELAAAGGERRPLIAPITEEELRAQYEYTLAQEMARAAARRG